MGKTSTASKNKYNKKNYKRWFVEIKISEFEEIENLRQDLSRPMFLKMLVENYKNTLNSDKSNKQ